MGSPATTKVLSDEPEASSESVEELADEGQAFEAEVVDGVENAPLADEARADHSRAAGDAERKSFRTKKSRARSV